MKRWFTSESALLDVGSGTGTYTISLAKQCQMIVGLDVSPAMIMRGLAKAKRLGLNNISFVVSDAMYLPFQDKVFDLVFSVNFFHHVADENRIIKGLREEGRCCRQRGRILIFDLNANSFGWSKKVIPKIIRGFLYLFLFPFKQRVIDNREDGTRIIDVSEFLEGTKKTKIILKKVGGFIPTYCPKFLFGVFISVEKIMDESPLLNRYGAHTLVVGEIQE